MGQSIVDLFKAETEIEIKAGRINSSSLQKNDGGIAPLFVIKKMVRRSNG